MTELQQNTGLETLASNAQGGKLDYSDLWTLYTNGKLTKLFNFGDVSIFRIAGIGLVVISQSLAEGGRFYFQKGVSLEDTVGKAWRRYLLLAAEGEDTRSVTEMQLDAATDMAIKGFTTLLAALQVEAGRR